MPSGVRYVIRHRLQGAMSPTAYSLGPGCKRCDAAVQMVKGADCAEIAGCGIAFIPRIVVDGRVVHTGGLPRPDDLQRWLAA